MKPAPFTHIAPRTLSEAVGLLDRYGEEARVLAGGQSLVPLMNLRLAVPAYLVDLNGIPDLAYVRGEGDIVAVGAMTRHREVAVSPTLARRCPVVAAAAAHIGYPAIRARGTIGGSLAHADPVAELPAVAVALEAEVVVSGPSGPRAIPATQFFLGHFTTAVLPNEIVVEIRFPAARQGEGWGFREFARKTGDFALGASAVRLRVRDGLVEEARIGLAGAADRPARARDAEASLAGRQLSDEGLEQAAQLTASSVDLVPGAPADSAYRRHLAGVLTLRALREAASKAVGGGP